MKLLLSHKSIWVLYSVILKGGSQCYTTSAYVWVGLSFRGVIQPYISQIKICVIQITGAKFFRNVLPSQSKPKDAILTSYSDGPSSEEVLHDHHPIFCLVSVEWLNSRRFESVWSSLFRSLCCYLQRDQDTLIRNH